METNYGIIVRQNYGTADLGVIAFECPKKAGMHLVDTAVVEIVDPASGEPVASGETGEVVVTPFNLAYPLLRFGTGDAS